MKKIYLIPLLFSFCYFLTSCNKDEKNSDKPTGSITFNYSSDIVKKAIGQNTEYGTSEAVPASIIVSVTDNAGISVFSMKEIPLYNMNGKYISKPIPLDLGSFKVTDFLVVDKDGNVLYLAPKEGSLKAYLVTDPLPVLFTVAKDQTTNVNIEVLKNNGGNPEDYGYSTFTFKVVDTFNFRVSVFTYNETIQNFQLTGANISISKDLNIIYQNQLTSTTNTIILRSDAGVYKVEISKSGYSSFIKNYTLPEIQAYNDSNPLVIILTKETFPLNGLVAYYPFNGNAKDSTQNHLDGICHATLTTDRFGKENSAYHFGSALEYIDLPNNSLLKPQFPITVSLWFKFEEYSVNNCLFTNDLALDVYCGVFLGLNQLGNPALSVGNGGYISANSRVSKRGNSTLLTNQWYHFVGVFKSPTDMQMYINGVNDGGESNGYATTLAYSNSLGSLGRKDMGDATQAPYYFKGTMDDIAFYNRALSVDEINALYLSKY